jgi:type I restriction enzyme M protein
MVKWGHHEAMLAEISMAKSETNKITDYISGLLVNATPEEVDSVQVFARQLVEDYGYDKGQIQTHPQYRVKVRPSDMKKECPVDIAVFSKSSKNDGEIFIIVECKKKNRKDGKSQLEDYLRFSKAALGVWFNGEERLFLQKVESKGTVRFHEIPNIPVAGQRVEDVGQFKRKNLKSTHNLKAIFKSIRNYLAANNVGTTRDEVLAQQLINLIFCKILDEKYTPPNNVVRFRVGIDENPVEMQARITQLFEEVKRNLPEVLDGNEKITLDAHSLIFVVGELQNYSLVACERDVIADAFEVFIGKALKGEQGQFFTPRNIVKMIVDILQPSESDKIIDPACGSGGFLIDTLKFIWHNIERIYADLSWSERDIEKKKLEIATKNFRGIDKDTFLSKVAKAYMNLIGDGTTGIFCDDSLEVPGQWKPETQQKIQQGVFDIVLTNPPFGAKIPVKGEDKLRQYHLGHKWKKEKKANTWIKGKLKPSEAPQVLFIERCMSFLKEKGRMGIVLPEGTFGNPSDRYIWNYLCQNAVIEAVISLPEETFQPHTHFKTSVLVLRNEKPKGDYDIFMSAAYSCGHNKNGKEIYLTDGRIDDDISLVAEQYRRYKKGSLKESHLGFIVKFSHIKNDIFVPNYYDPELKERLSKIDKKQFTLVSIGGLVADKMIDIKRGNEIGSEHYGKGTIPFIRTTDIVNWELKIDPIKCVPEEVYHQYKKRQDIKEGDILFNKDGTFLIGRTAFVTKDDEKIVIQSHILRIRLNDKSGFDTYYLLYLLNQPIVQKQVAQYTFVQGTISTVGDRLNEIVLPVHTDKKKIREISQHVKSIIDKKQEIKRSIDRLVREV